MTRSEEFDRRLRALAPGLEVRQNEPMAAHTTFRIGGPAERMAFPATVPELSALLQLARELALPVYPLGAGSNLLAPDEGLPGLVISLRRLHAMEQTQTGEIRCEAGVTLARLAAFAAQCGLTGLEFAHGIPGTVGGGIYMNAGAYGGELSQVVVQAQALDEVGQLRIWDVSMLDFGHRRSVFMREKAWITGAVFRLQLGEPAVIRARMEELAARRRASQPLELPSAGSAFKRPQGGYAAALIDAAGLKGLRIGDAAVSEKHAGFIVNLGRATAADVRNLIEEIRRRVLEDSGILLEPEIRILTGGANHK